MRKTMLSTCSSLFRMTFVLLCLFVSLSSPVSGQSASPASESRKLVVRENGWKVPGREDMTTIIRTEEVDIAGVKVKRSLLRSFFETEPLAVIDLFRTDNSGNIMVRSELCTVRGLSVYEINGQEFAFEASLIPTDAARNAIRVNIGIAYNLFFYDRDGDGNFETRFSGRILRVPEWALDKSRTDPEN